MTEANPILLPKLAQSLQGRDLGHLRIVADLWGLELNAPDTRVGLMRLAPALLQADDLLRLLEELPDPARLALEDLQLHDGLLAWPLFTRKYGPLREMGAARRDREQPHRHPLSATEMLYYRALIGRAFFDAPSGPEEFAYIPADLLTLLPEPQMEVEVLLGRPATPLERGQPLAHTDLILDHAATLLAALRSGLPLETVSLEWPYPLNPPPPAVLIGLLRAAGLLDAQDQPAAEAVQAFLEAPRAEALLTLFRGWRESPDFNELRLIPELLCEGEWRNDPLATRAAILTMLTELPPSAGEGVFWSLTAFVNAIQQTYPDFQRPAGDYDSWFIRSVDGTSRRGFEQWEAVEGALLRYLLTGPLYWLGALDLARPHADLAATAFRISAWGEALLAGEPPRGLHDERERVQINSDGSLRVPQGAPRALRYQLARFAVWLPRDGATYRYQITPASLERARDAGLRTPHLIGLLRRGASVVPPRLIQALERWESHGGEARLEPLLVLRLGSPEMLTALRRSRAGRFLGDPLGPTAVIVKPGAAERVAAALTELGYLVEASWEGGRLNGTPE
jgi:hypothetical protein